MDTKFGCYMEPEVVMRRRKFSREFKIEAVKLVRERGVSPTPFRPSPGKDR